jgi:hypothetical protein
MMKVFSDTQIYWVSIFSLNGAKENLTSQVMSLIKKAISCSVLEVGVRKKANGGFRMI